MSWDRSRYSSSRTYPTSSTTHAILPSSGRPPPYALDKNSPSASLPPVDSSSSSWSRVRERDDGAGGSAAPSSRREDPGWDAFRRTAGPSTSSSSHLASGPSLPPVSAASHSSSSLSSRRPEPSSTASKLDRWDSTPSTSGLPPPRPRPNSPASSSHPSSATARFTTGNWGSLNDTSSSPAPAHEEKVLPRRFGPVPSGPGAGGSTSTSNGAGWSRSGVASGGYTASLGPQSFGPSAPRSSRGFDSPVPLGPSRDRPPPSGPSRGRSRSPPPHQSQPHSSRSAAHATVHPRQPTSSSSTHARRETRSHSRSVSPESNSGNKSPRPSSSSRGDNGGGGGSRRGPPSPAKSTDHHQSSHHHHHHRSHTHRSSRRSPSKDRSTTSHRDRSRDRRREEGGDDRERERGGGVGPASSSSTTTKRDRWPSSTTAVERDEKRARWTPTTTDEPVRGRPPVGPRSERERLASRSRSPSRGDWEKVRVTLPARSDERERRGSATSLRVDLDDHRPSNGRKGVVRDQDVRMTSPPPAPPSHRSVAQPPTAPTGPSRGRKDSLSGRSQREASRSRDRDRGRERDRDGRPLLPPPRPPPVPSSRESLADRRDPPPHEARAAARGVPTGPADNGWGRKGRGGAVAGRGGWSSHAAASAREPPPSRPSAGGGGAAVELDAFGRPRRDYRSPSPDMEEIRRKRSEMHRQDELERERVREEEERVKREMEREKKKAEREEWARRQEEIGKEKERQRVLAEEERQRAEAQEEERRREYELQRQADEARRQAELAAAPQPSSASPQPSAFAPIKISLGGKRVPPVSSNIHPAQQATTSAASDRRPSQLTEPSPAGSEQRCDVTQPPTPTASVKDTDSTALAPPHPAVTPQPPTETYQKLAQVGEGTYGKVYKARNTETGAFVALKRIRMEGEKDGFPVTAMREIKLLQSLRHPNVVCLHEMMVSQGACHMVFEYMEHDLTGILSQPQYIFDASHFKSFAHQMLSGLAYLHDRGVLHRDMKGSNILIGSGGELKLADFGLARFYNKRRVADYTNRVITLWYRPVELLLGATEYGPEVDMWSAGCIILELFSRKTPFQGSDEINQLEKIYEVCGTPVEADWPGLTELPWYELLKKTDAPLSSRLADRYSSMLSPGALNLVEGLLAFNPKKRLLAKSALAMPYFTTEDPPMRLPSHLAEVGGEFHELEAKREKAKKRAKGKAEGKSSTESRTQS